jgi:hypothetical protein
MLKRRGAITGLGPAPDAIVRRDLLEENFYALRLDGREVIPSLPGAPSFFLASVYASRSASSLQTWVPRTARTSQPSPWVKLELTPDRSARDQIVDFHEKATLIDE